MGAAHGRKVDAPHLLTECEWRAAGCDSRLPNGRPTKLNGFLHATPPYSRHLIYGAGHPSDVTAPLCPWLYWVLWAGFTATSFRFDGAHTERMSLIADGAKLLATCSSYFILLLMMEYLLRGFIFYSYQ